MNVVERIAREIQKELTEDGVAMGIAQAILDLKYPCKECGGTKYVPVEANPELKKLVYIHYETKPCPTCKGTGQGEKMIGILDENQVLPENPYSIDSEEARPDDIYDDAQQDMLAAGYRKVKKWTI